MSNEERTRVDNLNLVSKILIYFGIVEFVVGAFLLLFVKPWWIGLIFMLVGCVDLGISVFFYQISSPGAAGDPGGEESPSDGT